MTGIFRANNPLNTSILFIYGVLLKLGWFINSPIPSPGHFNGLLYDPFINLLKPALDYWPALYWILGYLLLFSQALMLNYYINSRRMIQKPNYLPGMSYLLVTSFFAEWNVLSAPLVISTIVIWVWAKLSMISGDHRVKGTLYNLGLAIGVCSFLYFPAVAFLLLVLIALLIMRPAKIAEWILVILGLVSVWYILFAWLFVTDQIYSFNLKDLKLSYPDLLDDSWQYAGMIIIFFMSVLGFFLVQSEASRQVIQVRKRWSLILCYVLVALVIPFINAGDNFEFWMLAALPLSAFIGAAFFYIKVKWLRTTMHWIMVAFVIYAEFFYKP